MVIIAPAITMVTLTYGDETDRRIAVYWTLQGRLSRDTRWPNPADRGQGVDVIAAVSAAARTNRRAPGTHLATETQRRRKLLSFLSVYTGPSRRSSKKEELKYA